LKTQPFRVTFHDILLLVVYCLFPGDPGDVAFHPESLGVKIMDGVGFPTVSHKNMVFSVFRQEFVGGNQNWF